MSKICTSCNAENVDEAKFCRKCGRQNFKESDISSTNSMTELDMFFSDEFTEEEREKFRQKKDLESMEKRVEEIDKALKGNK